MQSQATSIQKADVGSTAACTHGALQKIWGKWAIFG